MKINIICVGKLKEKYLKEGIKEYSKRLTAYIRLNIIEVNDEKIPDNPSIAEEDIVKRKEGEKVLSKIKDDYVIVLDVSSHMIDSVKFSKVIEEKMINGISTITFVIGGSLGHSPEVLQRANMTLSLSPMTFPHQLTRLILLEQIYRSFKIMRNETYHK